MTAHTLTVITDAAGKAKALRVPSYLLRVLKGPDKRKEHTCAETSLLIGTGEAAGLRLSDGTVSALHCEIVVDETGTRVRDLGAKNGVKVAGRRVREAWLEPGDTLELGATAVRFKVLDDSRDLPLPQRTSLGRLRGASIAMRRLYEELARAAASDAPALLVGETGTGKELAAEALALEGSRKAGPLVVLNCGALSPQLAESELFGHEAGAFSGAARRHLGALERAHGGTLVLDEIGELPFELQPKLLGALDRKTFYRVGGEAAVAADFRLICATHRDLPREVNRRAFRADLYYRIAALTIRLPSLREHPEDIPELVEHFLIELGRKAELPPKVLEQLYGADYPGNVRDLRNAVERAVLGLEPETVSEVGVRVDTSVPFRVHKQRVVSGFERAYVQRLLEECEGNLAEAARRAKISRVAMHELVQRLKLQR